MGSDDHEWYAESGGDSGGRYQCAFCGDAHAACVPRAMSEEFRAQFEGDYAPPDR